MRLRSLAVIVIAGVGLLGVPSAVLAASGDLDPTFGIDGKVVASFGPTESRTHTMVLQPDGKIVVGGVLFNAGEGHFLMARFTASGVLDPTFGSGGSVITTVGGTSESIATLLLQSDGKILVIGNTYASENTMAMLRYEADGSLDPSFGTGGSMIATIGPGRGTVYGAALQPDGKIVAAGLSSDGLFAVARFESDGTADPTFGVGGEVLTDVGPFFDAAYCVALQPDGKILLAGTSFFTLGIVRYETDGSLDPSFGSGGIVAGGQPDYARALAVQPDGKILIAGDGDDGSGGTSDFNFKLLRLNADGTPDPTFNGGAPVTTAFGPYEDLGLSMVLQPSGRIVMGGYTTVGPILLTAFALVRFQPDGTFDSSFGVGGTVSTFLIGFGRDTARALALQPDNKLLLAGEHYYPPNGDIALVRYFGNTCGDGTIEPGEQCDDGNSADGDCCSSACQYDLQSAPCNDDANACTTDTCDGAGTCLHDGITCGLCEHCDTALGCVGRPRAGCSTPGAGGSSALVLRDRAQDAGDRVRWAWRSRTAAGDFGDPTTSDDYAFCIYDAAGETLWLAAEAPAGDYCYGYACWTGLGQPPLSLGAEYRDKGLTPSGISNVLLRANGEGPMRIRIKARGPLLGLPMLESLDLPLRVQMQRGETACWEATFNTAQGSTDSVFEAIVK